MTQAAPTEYPARRARWAADHAALSTQDRTIALIRLALFGLAVLLLVLAARAVTSPWWLLGPVLLFVPLLQRHERVIRARDNAARLVTFYERGHARLEDRWAGTGETGDRFREDTHLYADDVDLFGRASLFEFLSQARTRTGEETLARWLKHPAAAETIQRRHAAIEELRLALDLREALTLAGTEIRAGRSSRRIDRVGRQPGARRRDRPMDRGSRDDHRVAGADHRRVDDRFDDADRRRGARPSRLPARRGRADRNDATARRRGSPRSRRASAGAGPPGTRAVRQRPAAGTAGGPARTWTRAAAAIRTLRRYVEMHDWAHNIVFMPIAAVLMWDSHLAWAVQRWRARARHPRRRLAAGRRANSKRCRRWPRTLRASRRSVSADRRRRRRAVFDGEALGHPLIPAARMVRNDVRLDADDPRCSSSADRTCPARARCCAPSASTPCSRSPARRCGPAASPLAAARSARRCGSRTRCRQGRSRFYAEITRIRAARGSARGSDARAVPARRALSRHQLARPAVGAAGVLRACSIAARSV